MRGYLLDTKVISEYNREQLPHPGVVRWLETTPEALQYVSVLTLAEIEKGSCARRTATAAGTCSAGSRKTFPPTLDSQIAATALVHDLVLDTRNVKDYEGTGIALLNPWEQ